MMKPVSFYCLLITVGFLGTSRAQDAEAVKAEIALDPVTGMKMAEGWELVRNNCITCHSAQQFLRQKGTLTTWTEIIRWMQKSGGLWPLPVEAEDLIVKYLAENYGPSGEYRRAPIPATLLPENPYVSQARRDYEEKRRQGLLPTGAK